MASRRAKGDGSLRKRPDGRWEGRYTVGIDHATGKRIQKSVFGKTQAEDRDKLRTAIQENRGIEPNIGKIKLKQLTPLQIQQFYNRTKESGRVKRWDNMEDLSLSNRVVRGIHMVLRQALQQAVNERIINHNPCDHCRIPKLEKKEMKIIPPEQIGAYLQRAKEKGMLPMFYLELTSGLRRGELLALLWTDLDVEKRTITVNKSVSRVNGELVVSEPKTQNSVRTVAIPQQAVDLLVEDRRNHPDSPYLFPSPRTGGMWSPDAIGRTHKALLRAAGIDEGVRFHDLRHPYVKPKTKNNFTKVKIPS